MDNRVGGCDTTQLADRESAATNGCRYVGYISHESGFIANEASALCI